MELGNIYSINMKNLKFISGGIRCLLQCSSKIGAGYFRRQKKQKTNLQTVNRLKFQKRQEDILYFTGNESVSFFRPYLHVTVYENMTLMGLFLSCTPFFVSYGPLECSFKSSSAWYICITELLWTTSICSPDFMFGSS